MRRGAGVLALGAAGRGGAARALECLAAATNAAASGIRLPARFARPPSLPTQTLFPRCSLSRSVFYRERAAGMYTPLPMAIAQVGGQLLVGKRGGGRGGRPVGRARSPCQHPPR